ncbi:MAG: DNA-formamidopyrimidine glycosylase family protein [Tuberibacillus sp.]
MPEIPEMETYKNQLQRLIRNKFIDGVIINREKTIHTVPESFKKELLGQFITEISRFGKALFFKLSTGQYLFLHLMPGGKLTFGKVEDRPDRTKQIILSFGGMHLFYIGLRIFVRNASGSSAGCGIVR